MQCDFHQVCTFYGNLLLLLLLCCPHTFNNHCGHLACIGVHQLFLFSTVHEWIEHIKMLNLLHRLGLFCCKSIHIVQQYVFPSSALFSSASQALHWDTIVGGGSLHACERKEMAVPAVGILNWRLWRFTQDNSRESLQSHIQHSSEYMNLSITISCAKSNPLGTMMYVLQFHRPHR